MNKTLPDIIDDILTYNGVLVEQTDENALEVIAPQNISEILGIAEHARLCFSYNAVSDNSVYASYDSDLFKSLARLFEGRGKFSIARFETPIPNTERLTKVISDKISFSNAIFRSDKTELKEISYLLLCFKYTALSDEKQEGIIPILINSLNLSITLLGSDLDEIMERLIEDRKQKTEDRKQIKVFQSAYSTATQIVQERLKDFIKSLERRLNRDIKRVCEYYETLKDETKKAIERKGESAKGNTDKLMNKIDAIDAERNWKIQDLIAKYALSVQIEPVVVIRIETQVLVFWINIKRRLASRQFPITYNPIVRQFDTMPCESCFYPHGGYYICDDNLHIICANCFKSCSVCGKQYCKACYKDKCPKCKKENR